MKKSISLESIILVDGTELRESINEDRVEKFRDIYPQKHSEKTTDTVPPLDVFLIQTGDTKNRYALLDGRHRLTAAKLNKMRVIDVYIHNINKTLTIKDLESKDVIKTIFSESCRLNATHGLPLTTEDEEKAVFRLMELGCTPEEIISTEVVSRRKYFRIVKPETQKKKESRNKKIQEVISLKKQGVSFRKIAKQVEEKKETVKSWFKRGCKVPSGTLHPPVDDGDNDNKSQIRTTPPVDDNSTALLDTVYEHIRVIGRNKSVEQRIINDILPLLRAKFSSVSHLIPEPLESKELSDNDQKILDAMKNAISQINYTEYTDHKVVVEIIPTLRAKFPGVSSLINDSAYSSQIEELDIRCKTLLDELNKKHNTKLSYENQIQELRAQLDDRKKHCSYRCEHTKERLKKEFEKYVNFLMKTVTEHIESFDSFCSKDMSIIKELTINLALPMISVLEWGAFNSLTNEKTGTIIDDLQKILDFSRIINKDIVYRLNKVRKILEKSHSVDTESDHSLTGPLN